jgi:hypothetical protein
MKQEKQIVLKNRDAVLKIAGFGEFSGVIDPARHASLVAFHPQLESEFEEVTVNNEPHEEEAKAAKPAKQAKVEEAK